MAGISCDGTLRCFAPCPSGHLTGGYVARYRSPKFAYGQTSHIPKRYSDLVISLRLSVFALKPAKKNRKENKLNPTTPF